jgi:hypothetical protein
MLTKERQPSVPVKETVLRRKELLKPLCKPRPIQTSDHRLRGSDPEAFRIPVDDTDLRVRVQDANSTVYPAGSQAIISIQGEKIFSLRSENANVPRCG